MAKQQPAGEDRSDIEFLYFKGKMKSADISALVAGFTSTRSSTLAARSTAPKRIAAPGTGNGATEPEEEVELELVEEADVANNGDADFVTAAPKAPRTKRIYPTPATVAMDMQAGGKPFKEFAREKGPKSHFTKYLVAAAWCSEFAQLATITAGHVRTCYIDAGWNYKVIDPLQPFRDIAHGGLGSLDEGNFTIGHLGLSKVQDMKDGKVAK